MAYDLTLTYILSAPPMRVMELLTDTALIRRWSGGEAILEASEGGAFGMFDGWVFGKVVKVAPNELVYTWKTTDWDEAATPSLVTFQLQPSQEQGTKVTLQHTGFPNENEMSEHKTGWSDYFFEPLEDYIMVFDNRG